MNDENQNSVLVLLTNLSVTEHQNTLLRKENESLRAENRMAFDCLKRQADDHEGRLRLTWEQQEMIQEFYCLTQALGAAVLLSQRNSREGVGEINRLLRLNPNAFGIEYDSLRQEFRRHEPEYPIIETPRVEESAE